MAAFDVAGGMGQETLLRSMRKLFHGHESSFSHLAESG